VVRGNATKQVTYKGDYNLMVLPDYKVAVYEEKLDNLNLKEESQNNQLILWKPKGKNLTTVFKNYDTNEMFVKDPINFRFFVQKDSLNIFDWEIKEDTKTILGYNCQLAVTAFRGRSYEAWFTSQLPNGGPWKFGDLPGMILAVKAVDDYVSWEAVGIRIKNVVSDFQIPENPFQLDKSLLWSEFKALYKEKVIAASKFTTKEGETYATVAPRIKIQRYIEEDDNDYTADRLLEKARNANN
jgi:GLPGLI family protein